MCNAVSYVAALFFAVQEWFFKCMKWGCRKPHPLLLHARLHIGKMDVSHFCVDFQLYVDNGAKYKRSGKQK